MEPQPPQPKSMVIPLAFTALAAAVFFGSAGYYLGVTLGNPMIEATPTPLVTVSTSPKASTSPKPTTTSSSETWKKYSNDRVGYEFEYNENDPNIDVDETFKFDSAKSYAAYEEADRIQFVYNKNSYSISTYITTEPSLESWLDYASKHLGTGTSDLTGFTKTTIDGKMAYSGKNDAATYIKHENKIIAIYGREPAGITMVLTNPTDSVYSHVLASFKFTK